MLHIYPALINGSINDLGSILTSLGKTIQAGILGFILCVVYIRTKNFWLISIIHALNDFFPMIVQYTLNIPEFDLEITNYTVNGEEGIIIFFYYIILILFMLPPVVSSYRQLKRAIIPDYGIFKEKWIPQSATYYKKEN